MIESTFTFAGTNVDYRLRLAAKDRRHLVVVFAGVSKGQHDFYGFDGKALDHVQGAVLWIKDSFGGNNAYYMCSDLVFDIERAVAALIDTVLADLELSADECTLLGGSKGGSAALLFGLKYSYGNIVASVPQTLIGTYTREKLGNTFRFMAGHEPDLAEQYLNTYLPALIANPRTWSKNIYIISSKQDPEYATHIEPMLAKLCEYTNFNLVLTDSMLVESHPEVTPYNIPFILGTLYHLCENVAPRFGLVTNGNGQRDRLPAKARVAAGQSPRPLSALHWAQIKKDKLIFAGYAVVVGNAVPSCPATSPSLVFRGQNKEVTVQLKSAVDAAINSKLYDKRFIDYRWAGILPAKPEGVSLEHLPEGEYEIHAAFAGSDAEELAAIRGSKHQTATSAYAGYHYEFFMDQRGAKVKKTNLDAHVAPDGYFKFSSVTVNDSRLNLSGTFIVPREWMYTWDEGRYVCTMKSARSTVTVPLATTRMSQPPLNHWHKNGAYTWSHFSTPGHSGIDLTSVTPGEYDCFVTFIRAGNVYTSPYRFPVSFKDPMQVSLGGKESGAVATSSGN